MRKVTPCGQIGCASPSDVGKDRVENQFRPLLLGFAAHEGGDLLFLGIGYPCPRNAPADRELAARLYGGNQEIRISQEVVLGIGVVYAPDLVDTRSAVDDLERVARIPALADAGVRRPLGIAGGCFLVADFPGDVVARDERLVASALRTSGIRYSRNLAEI